MRSTSELRRIWHPPCSAKGAAFLEAYRALDACLRRWNYRPKEGQTWGYNCRRITGGTGYSLHAYGPGGLFTFWSGVRVTTALAVDINSLANPYGPTLKTDMPPAMVGAIKAIRTNGGHRVWAWGGDYSRNKDAMHFEIVASPAELSGGIDWATVGGQAPAVGPLGSRLLRQGDKGPDVAEWQQLLRIAADGDFGPATHSATVAFQQRHGLDPDGVVGPATIAAARPRPTPQEDDLMIMYKLKGSHMCFTRQGGRVSHIPDHDSFWAINRLLGSPKVEEIPKSQHDQWVRESDALSRA